jgi:Rieske 2Fe-2S family protein
MTSRLRDLIARRRPGWSLESAFYNDEEVYRADLDRIWRRSWLVAGHTCQLREPGDWFAIELGADPVIVIRGDDGVVRALHNVCRHRGSVICEGASGRAGKLVCPYHQWVYGRDGRLVSCRGMQEGLDKAALSLKPVHARAVEGLIFVSFAERPPDFEAASAALAPMLKPQGFERAKVAKIVDYEIAANWKLVWENNRECFHCIPNHPQYVKANWDHYNADDSGERVRAELAAATARGEARWAAAGLAPTHRNAGMTVFPQGDCWYSANRTPLVEGYLSESMDGRQVAPLMGDYTDADVGTLRVRTLPNFWNHSSCDHGVSTVLLPRGPRRTLARVIWTVREDAVEGRDYDLERLLPFWQLTSEQDWEICARQQRGVDSSAYEPGPYSTFKEYNVDGFVRWYLERLRGEQGRAP